MKLSDAVHAFLTEHLGESFCVECLALKLRGTPDIPSSAIFEVEGRGARHVQGICSVCGNRRLVASLPGSASSAQHSRS